MRKLEPEQKAKLLGRRYLSIGEVSLLISIPTHIIRYWEEIFPFLKPSRRSNRRYYTQDDLKIAFEIKELVIDKNLKNEAAKTILLKKYQPSSKKAQKCIQARNYKNRSGKVKKIPLPEDYTLYPELLAETCGISVSTARNYIRFGEAPYSVSKLLDLTLRGRILPNSWNHCFFNHQGNLEIYSVGEVSENHITNMQWAMRLNKQLATTLKNELIDARKRIEELEEQLSRAHDQSNQANKCKSEIKSINGRPL